jgi:hypothetical protein
MADKDPDPVFSLNLGNGVYMDSNGALHNGPVPNVPTYQAPFTLPVDPKKIKDALTSVKDALSDISKKGFLHDKWGKVDEIDKILDILAGIGKLAGYVAPVAAALGVLVDALKLFGVLKDEESGLEKKFDEFKLYMTTHVTALAKLMQSQYLETARSEIDALSKVVNAYAENLRDGAWDPTPEQLAFQHSTLITAHNEKLDGFGRGLAVGSWVADFARSDHTLIWPMLGLLLNVVPGVAKNASADTPGTMPIAMPADGPNFDHRLMFPFASFAIGTYLACIRGISPEYRTTGEFRTELMGFAADLETLATTIRGSVLARTIYTADQFQQIFYDYDNSLRIPFKLTGDSGLVPVPDVPNIRLKPGVSHWPVGAMDLRYHDDAYFSGFLAALAASDAQAWASGTTSTAPTKLGTMDIRWMPPARFMPGPFPHSYQIANREECAAAANAQSETDYADLLAMSGYPELMRLSALCRNEATEPSVSETVIPGKVKLYSNPEPETEVTVQSNPVHFTGQIITATAKRAFQECMCKTKIKTQSVIRLNPIRYRIVLRTLNSMAGQTGWRDTEYSDFQICTYEENLPDHPGFKRLQISHGSSEISAAPLIGDWTSSPREPIHREGTVSMKATTFDWWVPTPPEPDGAAHDDYVDHLTGMIIDPWQGHLEPIGDVPDMILTDTGFGGRTDQGPSIPELAWQRPKSPPVDGQHRVVREETVHIRYTLDWNRDDLQVTAWNKFSERNYVIYLVVEEQMQSSSNVLHTAVPLPMDGLITRVPVKFFINEASAHAKTAKIIAGLIPKHIPKVGEIVPDDGGVAWIRPGDLLTPEGVERVMTKLQTENPAFFDEVVTEFKRRDAIRTAVA